MSDQHSGDGSSSSGASGGNNESTVELNIKTLDSQIYSFHMDKNSLVRSFKEKIANKIGVPVGQQRLIFRGKVLKDDHLLSEYHVENGHTLHLVERQPVQSQPASDAASEGTNGNGNNRGIGNGAIGARNRIGQISHSVVLGTFNAGDQGEGAVPDLGRVIGSVLNSFGIGNQSGVGGAQPNVHSVTPNQTPLGNASEGSRGSSGGQSEAGNQAQGSQTIPLQVPLAGLTPIPHALYTLSEVMTRMVLAFTNGQQQGLPIDPGAPAIELPSDARGLPTVEALGIVLRQAQQILTDLAVAELSHIAGRLENDGVETDPAVRSQIQAETMQLGLVMQHLGALFLELGRTMLTLRMGQSPAESFVNAGPAVYMSALGPNPLMVQPLPLQTSTLFGSAAGSPLMSGNFGPVGIGGAPRHINIHIHAGTSLAPGSAAVGPRPSNGEGVQVRRANGAGSHNSTRQVVVPLRNIIGASVPPRSTGAADPTAAQPSVPSSQGSLQEPSSIHPLVHEINLQLRNMVDNMGGHGQPVSATTGSSDVQNESVGPCPGSDVNSSHLRSMPDSGAGEANISLPFSEVGGEKENNGGGGLSAHSVPSTFSTSEAAGSSNKEATPSSVDDSEDASGVGQDDNDSLSRSKVPLGLGLGGLQPKRRNKLSKPHNKSDEGTSSNPPSSQSQDPRTSGRQILQSLASGVSSAGRTNENTQSASQVPPFLGQIIGSLSSGGQGSDGQLSDIMSQVTQNLSAQTGDGSPNVLMNMMEQFTRNPLLRNTVNQIAQQIDGQDLENMFSDSGSGQGSGIDLSRMVQQMMPIVSQALGGRPTSSERPLIVENEAIPEGNTWKPRTSELDHQINLEQVTQSIEHGHPPSDVFHSLVEATTQVSGNGLSADNDLVRELCSDEQLASEYMEILRHDVRNRLQGSSNSADKS